MNDSDIEEHIVAEENIRNEDKAKREKEAAAANTPAGKANAAINNATNALGTGLWNVVNPVHTNPNGDVNWGLTIPHVAADIGLAAIPTGYALGLGKRAYNFAAGVDPTIAAQNEVAREKMQQQQQAKVVTAQPAPVPAPAPAPAPAPIQAPSPTPQSQGAVPPTQEQLVVQRTAQMQNDLGKPAVPAGNPKVGPQDINLLNQNQATKLAQNQYQENEHSLDKYTRKMVVQAGMQNMNTKELSRLTGVDIRDQRDVQRAITKHNAERLAEEGLKKALESEHGRKTLTEEQIKSRQALREMKAPGQPAGAVAPVNPQHGYQFHHGAVPPTFHLNPFNVFEGINKAKEEK